MTTQNADALPSTLFSNEDRLIAHSADYLIFSRYLECLPERVSIDVKDSENDADVYAVYWSEAGEFRYKFARFMPDDTGVKVSSEEFYAGIHKAFRGAAQPSSYLGFRGCGRFAVAPLMLVAKLYERFGRGLFLDGKSLPSPYAEIEKKYGDSITSFRTSAPLKQREYRKQ